MKATYDESVDALYITLGPAKGKVMTREVGPGIFLDFDSRKTLVGLEVLDASTHYPKSSLAGIEPPVEWLTLAEAEREIEPGEAPLSAGSLKNLLAAGTLEGRKVGKTWQIARHVLATYLANRPKRGPKIAQVEQTTTMTFTRSAAPPGRRVAGVIRKHAARTKR